MCFFSTNIHFDYDGHYSKAGDDYEWIPTDAQFEKAYVVGIIASVRMDMKKKRMWALVWNTMNTPQKKQKRMGCKPIAFSFDVFIV
ncbi:unnamed protein product [Brassica rapa subsp. narinosa]